jgi:hypothetical protein
MHFSIFAKMWKWDDFCEISLNFISQKFSQKTKNPLNFAVIRHAWYMWCNVIYHFRKIKISRKYEHFRTNAKIFSKISSRKLTLIAESLLMWNTWGMGHHHFTQLANNYCFPIWFPMWPGSSPHIGPIFACPVLTVTHFYYCPIWFGTWPASMTQNWHIH